MGSSARSKFVVCKALLTINKIPFHISLIKAGFLSKKYWENHYIQKTNLQTLTNNNTSTISHVDNKLQPPLYIQIELDK